MQAIDTNILIYAEVRSSPHHDTALSIVKGLSEGALPWAIPWPCVYEFLRVVTHARVFHPPTPVAVALRDLRRILNSPSLVLLRETSRHADIMLKLVEQSGVSGNLMHDAHIAALCLEHGVTELLSGDRDFARFPSLKARDPFA